MSKATIIADAFGEGASLYDVLGVPSDERTSQADLRKAYYRRALTCHPDKVRGKEKEFHALSVAYEILKDPETRAEYDRTGEYVDEDDQDDMNGASVQAWTKYFNTIFGRITTSKIDQFAEKYKCSEEEEQDVLKYYVEFKGNMKKMLDSVMLSTPRDLQRWIEDFIQPAIHRKQVPDYSKKHEKTLKALLAEYDNEEEDMEGNEEIVDENETESEESDAPPPRKRNHNKKRPTAAAKPPKQPGKKSIASENRKKRKSKAQQEAEEAELLMAKIRGNRAITQRKASFGSLLGNIASKYGRDSLPTDDDPLGDDEEFARIQEKIIGKNKKARAKR